MSKSHTVVLGDRLGDLSIRYYGVWDRWVEIRAANPQLIGRRVAVDGSPLIFPGDILVIPDAIPPAPPVNTAPATAVGPGDQDFSILIDGKSFTGFTGFKLSLLADSLDAFSASGPFDDSIADFRQAFVPFAFKPCAIYYKGNLIFNGRLLTPDPQVTESSRSVSVQGYPLCGILNDVALPPTKYPGSYRGLKLSQISADMAGPFAVSVKVDGNEGSAFKEVAIEPEAKILQFLSDLGKQRGLLFTNDSTGNLVFYKFQAKPVGAKFKEGEYPFVSCVPRFSPQEFYSHVTGFTKTEKDAKSAHYTYENKYLTQRGILRPYAFVAEDVDNGAIQAATEAEAGRIYADAVSYQLTIEGVTDQNGQLYQKGMTVAVESPGAMIYRETEFVARSVLLSRDDSDGEITIFDLVLPGAYTGSLPGRFPWED